jgi:hypothetical protein
MKELSTQEIVKRDKSLKEAGVSWKHVYYLIHETIKKKTHRIMRSGDTLFWYQILPNKQIAVTMFTADPEDKLREHYESFQKACETAGLSLARGQ